MRELSLEMEQGISEALEKCVYLIVIIRQFHKQKRGCPKGQPLFY
jgi:hypothetical protein